MQIDQDLEAGLFCPVKSVVERFVAMDKRINIIKQKILSVNEKLVNIKDNIKPVSISVGVAFGEKGFSEDLFKNADRALYIVKEKGKRGCEIYDD